MGALRDGGWREVLRRGRELILRRSHLGLSLFAIVWLVAILVRLPTLGHALLESDFRQAQTAYTALLYSESGIDLLHPQLPVRGAPWEIPFEFPIFQAVASLVIDLGVAPETALRTSGLLTFLATAALVLLLTRHLAGSVTALAATAFFLLSPFSLLWSRTAMIEYTATAAAIAAAFAGLRWIESERRGWLAIGLLCGSVALLVKPTTGFAYLVPVALYGIWRMPRPVVSPRAAWHLTWLLALGAVPVTVTLAWTLHADAVKAASPATAWLTSSALSPWNFGSIAQRTDPATWQTLIGRMDSLLLGGATWVWLLLALGWSVRLRHAVFAVALLASSVLPLVVFTNLFWHHDYYIAAISPILAIGMGFGVGWLWRARRARLAKALAVALAVSYFATFVATQATWLIAYNETDFANVLPAAAAITQRTNEGDLVAITGRDWSPSVLYHARRQGFMVRASEESRAFLEQLQAQGYIVFSCPPTEMGCAELEPSSRNP